jgi:phosphodiesterase/alkaline phosphatase D-like protein
VRCAVAAVDAIVHVVLIQCAEPEHGLTLHAFAHADYLEKQKISNTVVLTGDIHTQWVRRLWVHTSTACG